jgi:hypothetical protein
MRELPYEVGTDLTDEYIAAQKAKQHMHPLMDPTPVVSNIVGNLWETFE